MITLTAANQAAVSAGCLPEYCVLGEICWRTRMVSPDRNGLADQQSGANDASPSNTVTEIGSLQHIERKLTYMLGLLAIIALALFIK